MSNLNNSKWGVAIMAFGFFLIASSPLYSYQISTVVAGLSFVGFGYWFMRKNS